MTIEQRINAFTVLGKRLRSIDPDSFISIAAKAASENPWFTSENVRMAWQALGDMLHEDGLRNWVSAYNLDGKEKIVAIIMAGNVPMVGFHDLLSVLISGHTAQIKLSSKDAVLMRYIAEQIINIEPGFSNKIIFSERLKDFDAIIATGSDNTSRYFEYYFGKYPHIIRQNRTSCAVLTGEETAEELGRLGIDIFSYFGLGCRNVSKLYVPRGYDFSSFFENLDSFKAVGDHHKYINNYDYQKSIMLLNRVPFLDNGFLMLTENEKTVSPISVVYYEYYEDQQNLNDKLNSVNNKLQCIIGKDHSARAPFGKAQSPGLRDYADNIDTLIFLNVL